MSKWNLIFDADRCNSCNNCVLATKDEYLGNSFKGYSKPAPDQGDLWFTLKRHERGQSPMIDVSHFISTCLQCDDAPCIAADKSGAISKRADGIVVIDPNKAKGNRDLASTCPYGHIYWNEEEQVAQKWSFDAHLIDNGWSEPRCSQICPTEALKAVKLTDAEMQERARRENLSPPPKENNPSSRVWYKNLECLTHHFLGGTVVEKRGETEHCLEGVKAELLLDNSVVATASTDAFGDFKFHLLEGNGETYLMRLTKDNHEIGSQSVTLQGNHYLGVISV